MGLQFERYFGIYASAMTIIGVYLALFLPNNKYPVIGYIIILITAFLIGYYCGLKRRKNQEKNFTIHLIKFFEQKSKEGKDAELIRWGISLSKPLWLSQKYKIRKQIGEFVEKSAINKENYNARIKVLIDDIGWTNVELGEFEEAKKMIEKGINLAREKGNRYYLAKGFRHLFGINFRQDKLKEAEKFLNKSKNETDNLIESRKKEELTAEYHFAKSSLEHKKKNYSQSLNHIEIAHNLYENLPDKEWSIKILARKGEILISQNKVDEAKDIFLKGLNDSKNFQFNKQIVKNLIGLGKVYFELRNFNESRKYLDSAFEIADNIDMYYEKSLIEKERRKLNSIKL